MNKSVKRTGKRIRLFCLFVAIAVFMACFAGCAQNTGKQEESEEGTFSEEQAEERLRTLEEALQKEVPEVIPMQFFLEDFQKDKGTFHLVAVTTMPEDEIEEVSFLATSETDPKIKYWYTAEERGNGYYDLFGAATELGNKEGEFTIHAYITPRGGNETEAGDTTIEIDLEDYLYTEARGGGVQSLVLVHPFGQSGEEPDEAPTGASSETPAGTSDETPTGSPSVTPTETPGVTPTEAPTVTPGVTTDEAAAEEEEETVPTITRVFFKVWSEDGEQEDLRVYDATEETPGIWSAEMSLDEFETKGNFIANAYAVIDQIDTGVASETFELLPDPVEVPSGEGEVQKEGKRVSVDVPDTLQNPELPTGCESVALTIALSSLGYDLEKTEIAKNYLERGDNFAISYVGDPFSPNGAGCFPPAIVRAANKYLIEKNDTRRGHNLTGTSLDDLCAYIDNGIPVIVWSSMYMQEPQFTGAIAKYHGQQYEWYRSEHCVVLYGYDDEKSVYLISDPLVGYVERDKAAFERIFEMTGTCSVVIY